MKIGFIGSGNMGSAILGGVVSAGIVDSSDVIVTDTDTKKAAAMAEKYNVKQGLSNELVTGTADILFLCVKPQVLYSLIDQIKESVRKETVIVSIVAGQSIGRMIDAFGIPGLKLVRVMPNTPALVGEGMAAVAPNENVSEEEKAEVLEIFNKLGRAEIVSESLMDIVTAVSGSSPAFVFMFIEAMADAAVRGGMPRDKAYTFAAQSVLGSAKMVLESGKHPGELKDMVCSPAGTTIDAVAVLEEEGMRSAVIKAVKACEEKSKNL